VIDQQLFDARLKANDVVQEHLKQIITIASATLALTVSFLKDVVGAAGAEARWPKLLPISWVALGVSILAAVIGIATLVNNLDKPDMTVAGTLPRAFAAGAKSIVVVFENAAIYTFAVGMLSLAVFGAKNYLLFLERKTNVGNETSITQALKVANHFVIVPDPQHITEAGKRHSHTYLLDQRSGNVWESRCLPNGIVEFRRVSVEGIAIATSP